MEKKLTNRQKQAIETKQKIYITALHLYANYSIENVTIQDICKEASVSIGTFYHYYKSKYHVLDEGYRFFDEDTETNFTQKEPSSSLESIIFLIKSQVDEVENVGYGAFSQFIKYHLTNEGKYILNENRYFPKTIFSIVSEAVNNNELVGDAKKITDEILSITRGILYDWCIHEGNYNLEERSITATEILLKHYMPK